jgi:hypothetical protein
METHLLIAHLLLKRKRLKKNQRHLLKQRLSLHQLRFQRQFLQHLQLLGLLEQKPLQAQQFVNVHVKQISISSMLLVQDLLEEFLMQT